MPSSDLLLFILFILLLFHFLGYTCGVQLPRIKLDLPQTCKNICSSLWANFESIPFAIKKFLYHTISLNGIFAFDFCFCLAFHLLFFEGETPKCSGISPGQVETYGIWMLTACGTNDHHRVVQKLSLRTSRCDPKLYLKHPNFVGRLTLNIIRVSTLALGITPDGVQRNIYDGGIKPRWATYMAHTLPIVLSL